MSQGAAASERAGAAAAARGGEELLQQFEEEGSWRPNISQVAGSYIPADMYHEQSWHLGTTNYRYKPIIGGFSELLNRFIITRK